LFDFLAVPSEAFIELAGERDVDDAQSDQADPLLHVTQDARLPPRERAPAPLHELRASRVIDSGTDALPDLRAHDHFDGVLSEKW
jgi:hypothetical protein